MGFFEQITYYGRMHSAHKEHLLHKVLAGSAFVFALALLPVAAYFFGPTASTPGSVAGVSTERPLADVAASASPLDNTCTDRQAQLDGLDRLQASWQASYAQEIGATSDAAVVDAATSNYQKEFSKVEAERARIESVLCK